MSERERICACRRERERERDREGGREREGEREREEEGPSVQLLGNQSVLANETNFLLQLSTDHTRNPC